ncbi:MAG: choice-of-anchor L domain-containing protein, partial [Flavobacteriales bacterium]
MNKSLYFLLSLFTVQSLHSQISGNCNAPYNTPESLVEILVGEGVEYSNVTFSGFDCSAGYFDGTSNLDFQTGLVLATNGVESIAPDGFGFGVGGGAGT